MRRGRRITLPAIVLLVVLLVAGGIAGWSWLRGSLPQTTGTVTLPGLESLVTVVRDADGVPHIFAATDHDAVFALGYVHAQDRIWQMEMNRRIGHGRLSEVLGEGALPIDKFQRTMGYTRVAQANWDVLSPAAQALLDAYAAGVNAWIGQGHRLPPEFLLLRFAPEPWTPLDSLVWVKMMQWDLGGDYGLELVRAQLTQALGPARAAQILPAYPADALNILPDDALEALEAGRTGAAELLALNSRFRTELGLTGLDVGSNNWVVHGSRTATGLPLLANDPHLGASIPSIWYLAEIQGDRLHVTGATFPGLPLFPIGHNEAIAWGVTNVDPDVQDLYAERVNPANPNQVEVNGAWVDMTVVEEIIHVDGQEEPLRWAARATRNGPLISDVESTAQPVALRWTALDLDDTTLDAFLAINYAQNWEQFRAAMQDYVAPSQNFVYADVDGNIGYFMPGRIPIRAQGEGMLPAPGWNDDYAWQGFIPFDELPQALNPEQGYIATANHRVVDERYPYLISNSWSEPYRAERIVELIEQYSSNGETISLQEMAAIQADQTSVQARALLPFLLGLEAQDERQRTALALLEAWDGAVAGDSAAAALYEVWVVEFERALLEDDLSGALWEEFANWTHPVFVRALLDDPSLQAVWCDNVLSAGVDSCSDTALVALDRALDMLSGRFGGAMERWRWQALHRTQYPHRPFSDVGYLRWIFHRSIANGGDAYTVNVAPVRYSDLYHQYHVPSYRHIVDLQDFQRSLFMTTTGQSGNLLSPHYDDLIERHRDVEYIPMTFGRDAATGAVLTLQP